MSTVQDGPEDGSIRGSRPKLAVLAALVLAIAAGATAAQSAPNRNPSIATMTSNPGTVTAGVSDTLQLRYQANLAFANADVTLVVPAGWTPPVTTPATANGYVSLLKGNCTVPNTALDVTGGGPWTVTAHGVTCGASKSFTISYAKAAFGLPGSTSTFTGVIAHLVVDPAAIKITPGTAARLAFTQAPTSALGGSPFVTQPLVAVQDVAGNLVAKGTPNVTLSLTGGTAGAVLSCTANPRPSSGGVASFVGCKINKVGSGYRLRATSGTLQLADSAPFAVSAGPGATLSFSQQPGGAVTSGAAFPTQPKVTVLDLGGNPATGDASTVTLSLTAGTPTSGGPGSLFGCSQTESAGVVTFSACTITVAGTGYKLHATDGALTAADSTAFNVTAPLATQLIVTQDPGGAITGGVPFPTQPKVMIADASGNPVTTDASTVTLSITGGTPSSGGPGTLSGCTQTRSAGVVTFSGCKIDKTGTGYRLHVADGALTPADTAAFNVAVGPAANISLGLSPASVSADVGSSTATATLTDAGGNRVSGAAVTITSGDLDATVGSVTDNGDGTYTATASSTESGTHDITAAVGTLHDTETLTITPGAASSVTLVLDPATVSADTGTSAATASVADAYGNPVAGETVTITSNDTDATVGTVTDNADGTYDATVSSTTVGSYDITAADGAASDTETLTLTPGAASTLAFVQHPGGNPDYCALDELSLDCFLQGFGIIPGPATGGLAFPFQPHIGVLDAAGNSVDATPDVTLSITAGTGAASAGLDCAANPLIASGGVATFSGCAIDLAATDYRLRAQSPGLTSADSDVFAVLVGIPSSVTLSLSKDTIVGDGVDSTAATVTLVDAGGNRVPGQQPIVSAEDADVSTVTDQGDGTYTATITSTTLGADTVTASSTPDGPNDAASLTVVPGAASSIALALDPDSVSADVGSSSATATVSDTGGNPVPGAAVTITSADTGAIVGTVTNNGDGTYTATITSTDAGTHDITAAVGALDDTKTLTVTPGAATSITLALDPTSVSADVGSSTATATVTDAYGNPLAGETVTITSGDTGAIVGTVTNNGDGTYTATITSTAVGTHDITAADGLLDDTKTLTITPGAATSITLALDPTSVSADVGSSTATATVTDAYGNPLAGETVTITSGDLDASVGTVTDQANGTYTATVTSTAVGTHDITAADGLLDDTKTLTITAAATDALVFTQQPGGYPDYCASASDFLCLLQFLGYFPPPGVMVGGEPFDVQPVVSVVDEHDNVVAGDTSSVTLSISSSTGTSGATLTCDTNPVAAVDGAATFQGCRIDKAGTGYQLHAVATARSPADSDPFDVVVGHGTAVSLSLSEDTIEGDGVDSTIATVTLSDAGGNPVTNDTPSLSSAVGATISSVTNLLDGTYTWTITSTISGADTITASNYLFLATPTDTAALTINPVDDDSDAVPNERDLCSDTVAGADVDADGCSAAQRAANPTADADGDGVPNATDRCEGDPQDDYVDSDGCTSWQRVIFDQDSDVYLDELDNCPSTWNRDQADLDGDGTGDACDADMTGQFTVQPGEFLELNELWLNSCDSLELYVIVAGHSSQLLGSNYLSQCSEFGSPLSTVQYENILDVPVTVTLLLDDLTCGARYYSDGNGDADHARTLGSNPSTVQVMDAGGPEDCISARTTAREPTTAPYNLHGDVTVLDASGNPVS